MPNYKLPTISERPVLEPKTVWLVASGDLRQSPTQRLADAGEAGTVLTPLWPTSGGPPTGPCLRPGQVMGSSIASVWNVRFRRYTSRCTLVWPKRSGSTAPCLAGLRSHRGPVLTVANFDGTWPGLVGLLNLNASMTKMGREYSTIWSTDFTDSGSVTG